MGGHADGLVPANATRHDLFDDRDRQKQSRLMKALDAINSDYGARTIHFDNLGRFLLCARAGKLVLSEKNRWRLNRKECP